MTQNTGHIEKGQRQEQVYDFLCHYMKASKGRPPTLRDIQKGTKIPSLRYVHLTLRDLEKAGKIRRARFGRTRGIGIVGARYLLPGETGGRNE